MKKKQLNLLGHSMLKAQALLIAGIKQAYTKIKSDDGLSRKQENSLLRGLLDANILALEDIASIMSAAENSDTFKYTEDDDRCITHIAEALGIKVKFNESDRDALSVDRLAEAFKPKRPKGMSDEVNEALTNLASVAAKDIVKKYEGDTNGMNAFKEKLRKVAEKTGKGIKIVEMNADDLPDELRAVLEAIDKKVKK